MTFKAITPVLLCLACAGMLGKAGAQGVRLKTSPSIGLSASNGSALTNPAGPIKADYIVAVVNSEPVTNNEVRTRLIRYERRLIEQRVAMPSRPDLMRDVLEDVISEKIQLQLARESNMRIDERAIDAALLDYANQNKATVEEIRNRMSADGIGIAQIRADIQNQLLIQKVRDRELVSRIVVPELDIDNYLKEQFGVPESGALSIDLAQILIAVPDNATEAQIQTLRTRAERILALARSGTDFFKLTQENSDAKDAGTGGQMGLRSIDRYPTLFVEATQNLPQGAVSGIIRSGAGFHVLKVLTKQQDSKANFSVTQTKSRHILLRTGPQLSEDAAKAKLLEFKKRIESGTASFATLAKDNSQDGSAADGGSLGWTSPGQFVPEFESVMNQLSPGQLSNPVVSRFGVHLILLEERRKNQISVAEQRELARNALRAKKLDEAYVNWIRDLRSNTYVEYREPPQ